MVSPSEIKYRKVALDNKYPGYYSDKGLLAKYVSNSKSNNEKKYWIGKEIKHFDFALGEALSGSLAVGVLGKANAPKTKLLHEKRMLVSRMPEGKSNDLGVYLSDINNISDKPLPHSFASAIAIKMILGDGDIKLNNIVKGRSRKDENGKRDDICFSIDGEFSAQGFGNYLTKRKYLRGFNYNEFEEMVGNPVLFVSYSDPSLSAKTINSRSPAEYSFSDTRKKQITKFLSQNVKPEHIVDAFSQITERLKEDNYALFGEVIGTYLDSNRQKPAEKGIKSDLFKGFKNGVYSKEEVAFASGKLEELKNNIVSFVDEFSQHITTYKERNGAAKTIQTAWREKVKADRADKQSGCCVLI